MNLFSISIISIGFIIGLILGSFVKALADRSLSNKTFWGRSKCFSCHKVLGVLDLIPILSYLILKGRCRFCHKSIGVEYLWVEVLMGCLIGFLFWTSLTNFEFIINNFKGFFDYQFLIFLFDLLFKTFFISVLMILTLTDLKEMFIPDRIILPSLLVGLISFGIFTIYKIAYFYLHLSSSSVGRYLLPPHSTYFQQHALDIAYPFLMGLVCAIAIGGFFYFLIVITKGKGMGGGDVKLGAFMGLMLSFPNSLVALILAFFTGAVFSVVLLALRRKKIGQVIPFGPFLVLGSIIALFWGQEIFNWYLKLGY